MLQDKLDDAVTKISELTDVLTHLNQAEYNPERYYEESAQRAAELINKRSNNAAASQNAHGGAQSTYKGGARSHKQNESQITGTNATRSMRTTKKM